MNWFNRWRKCAPGGSWSCREWLELKKPPQMNMKLTILCGRGRHNHQNSWPCRNSRRAIVAQGGPYQGPCEIVRIRSITHLPIDANIRPPTCPIVCIQWGLRLKIQTHKRLQHWRVSSAMFRIVEIHLQDRYTIYSAEVTCFSWTGRGIGHFALRGRDHDTNEYRTE